MPARYRGRDKVTIPKKPTYKPFQTPMMSGVARPTTDERQETVAARAQPVQSTLPKWLPSWARTMPRVWPQTPNPYYTPAQQWINPAVNRVEPVPPGFQGYPVNPAVQPQNYANYTGNLGLTGTNPKSAPKSTNPQGVQYMFGSYFPKLPGPYIGNPSKTLSYTPPPATTPPADTSGSSGYPYYPPYGGGGGDYNYQTYASPFAQYQQGYAAKGVGATAAPAFRTAGQQAQNVYGNNTQVYPARWQQLLTSWRI